jgi:ABC-type histidine transport system ATPase subunit
MGIDKLRAQVEKQAKLLEEKDKQIAELRRQVCMCTVPYNTLYSHMLTFVAFN